MWTRVKVACALAAAGVPVGAALTWYLAHRFHSVVYVAVGVLSVAACAGYLVLESAHRKAARPSPRPSQSLVPDLLYWLLLAASLVVFANRPDPDSRPLSYFVLTALACGVLAAKILSQRCGRGTLVQVVLIGLSLTWTVASMFPSLIGLDPYWHQYQTQRLLSGDPLGVGAMPGMSYLVARVMWLTGLSYKWGAFLGVSVVQVVADAALVYSIGSMVSGRRVGLLAALLVTVANWHIFFGIWPIPNTLAATLLLGVLWALVKWHRDGRLRWLLLTIPLLAAILVTHVLVSVWAALAVAGYAGLRVLWRGRDRLKRALPVALLLAGLLASTYLVWHSTGHTNTARMLLWSRLEADKVGFPAPPGTDGGQVAPAEVPPTVAPLPTPSSLPRYPASADTLSSHPWELLLNSSGMFLFFALAILGVLAVVRRGRRGELYLSLLGGGYLAVGFVPMLMGISVLEQRWWYAAQVVLVVPVALAVRALLASLPRAHTWAAATLLVGGLSFLGMIGLPGNIDNRSLSPNQIVRYALTEDELSGVRTAMEESDGLVGMDTYLTMAGHYFPQYRDRMVNISELLVKGDVEGVKAAVGTVVIREEVRGCPIGFGEGVVYRLAYDPVSALQDAGYWVVQVSPDATVLRWANTD